jgi:hypothetical protein
LKLLGQSLVQKGPDACHLRTRGNTNWVVGHNFLIQLLHATCDGRLIEKGGKVREPLGATRQDKDPFPNADAVVELRAANDSQA